MRARASDTATGMVATATAGVAGLVVFFVGLRDSGAGLISRRRPLTASVTRILVCGYSTGHWPRRTTNSSASPDGGG